MAFKEVQSLDADFTTPLGGVNKKTGKKNPTKAEGFYLGARKVESRKAKNGFSYIHFLQTPEGNIGVWGKTDLDRKLVAVKPGTMIRITHTGMQATPNGDMYKYKVEADLDNTIEVDLAASAPSESGDDETASVSAYSSDDDSGADDEQVADEAPPARAVANAAQNKKRIEELLSRKKN